MTIGTNVCAVDAPWSPTATATATAAMQFQMMLPSSTITARKMVAVACHCGDAVRAFSRKRIRLAEW